MLLDKARIHGCQQAKSDERKSAVRVSSAAGTSRAQQQLCPVKVTGSGVVVILLPGTMFLFDTFQVLNKSYSLQ